MIEPFEMAEIYWRRLRSGSIYEIQRIIDSLGKTSFAKDYWKEVMIYLMTWKGGRKVVLQ